MRTPSTHLRLGRSVLAEGNELPFSFGYGCVMTEDVEVAVVGANLEEDVFWTVPLVDDFLHKVFAMTHAKANWPFVPGPARIALNMQLHFIIVAHANVAASGYILLL